MARPFGCWRARAGPCFVLRREEAPPSPKSRLTNCLAVSPIPALRKIHSNKAAWQSAKRVRANLHRFRHCEAAENSPMRPAWPRLAAKYAAEHPPAADNLWKRKLGQALCRFDPPEKARRPARRGPVSLLRQSIDADSPA